jgi:hypothetical protein
MKPHTRYKLTLAAALFLAVVTLVSIFLKLETVATAGIAGIMTVLSTYIWSQTARPTYYPNEKSKHSTKSDKNVPPGYAYPGPMDILEKQ